MARLPVVSGNKFIKYLHKRGYIEKSCKGSHHNFKRPDDKGFVITVITHGNNELRDGTLHNIIKYLAKNEGMTEDEVKEELANL
jgi:predicted RNA binding protein YcfA (HicA-like mRNA interferase family)